MRHFSASFDFILVLHSGVHCACNLLCIIAEGSSVACVQMCDFIATSLDPLFLMLLTEICLENLVTITATVQIMIHRCKYPHLYVCFFL